MSKQVELKGDNLIVRTREDYKQASKVIVMRKGETSKVFYFSEPRFITDLKVVEDWTICGYRVEDLYKLALILRERRLEDVDLSNYNQCYFDGYKRAIEDVDRSIKESIDRMIRR